MSSSTPSNDFQPNLAEYHQVPVTSYFDNSAQSRHSTATQRGPCPTPTPTESVGSTTSRKRHMEEDPSSAPRPRKRRVFRSSPSASKGRQREYDAYTLTQPSTQFQDPKRETMHTDGRPLSGGYSEYSYKPSEAYRPEDCGEVRSQGRRASLGLTTEAATSPPGSESGEEEADAEATKAHRVDAEELNRLFGDLGVTDVAPTQITADGLVSYPSELEFDF